MGRLTQSTEDIQRILNESDGLRQFTEAEFNTLKGEGEGSIKQAVREGVDDVLDGASEAYDTLKEIEEYIVKDETGAVKLGEQVAELENQNKVITEELGKKADKTDIVAPDWNAIGGKAAVKNRPFGFNRQIRLSDANEITRELINADDDEYRVTYKFSRYQFEYGLFMFAKQWEYDATQSFQNVSYERIYSGDEISVGNIADGTFLNVEVVYDDYTDEGYETIITLTGQYFYASIQALFEENIILADTMESLRSPLPDIFIPDSVARQESIDEIYEEISLLWDDIDFLWGEAIRFNEQVTNIEGRVEELESGYDFETTGYFPEMSVGLADDLAGRGESVPAEFTFRASGGKSIKDGRAYIKAIKGNSVVWNQLALINQDKFSACGVTATRDGNRLHLHGTYADGGDPNIYILENVQTIPGHKYAIMLEGGDKYGIYAYVAFSGILKTFTVAVAEGNKASFTLMPLSLTQGMEVDEWVTPMIVDLTRMFGEGNEPTTMEEFYARIPSGIDLYTRNEGEVIHMNTESIKSVGDNAWDEVWNTGYIGNDENIYDGNAFASNNPIKILAGEQYYFSIDALASGAYYYIIFYDSEMERLSYRTLNQYSDGIVTAPDNAVYMRFYVEGITRYNDDILVSLVHSGWKQDTDAGYQPYWQDILPLPIIREYFPDGMKSAGTAHDEIRYNKTSGKWEAVKRIASVDLGSFSGWYNSTGIFWASGSMSELHPVAPADYDTMGNIQCAQYSRKSWSDVFYGTHQKIIGMSPDGQIGIVDTNLNSDNIFEALQGVVLYYELAEPIVTEITEDFRDYYNVADFGTEQAISSQPSAPFSANIIYQFNAVDMIREHEIEINELQSIIATMQAQLASLTNK